MIQSILFDRKLWTPSKAQKWLRNHGKKILKLDVTTHYLRYRQLPPNFKNYYTYDIGKGILLVLGK